MTLLAIDEEMMENVAGILAYWGLSGNVDMEDLREQLVVEFDEETADKLMPSPPSKEVVVQRAAQHYASGNKRDMVRPLSKRGSFVYITESVQVDDDMEETLEHRERVRIAVTKKDEGKHVTISPVGDGDKELAQAIAAQCKLFDGLLVAADFSSWLLNMITTECSAVSLRDRGGIYFVPRDGVEFWRRVMKATRAVSEHTLYEIPAAKSDEAVEAILQAVRHEAEAELAKIETYLQGEVTSTRGLNSAERTLEKIQTKLDRYVALLGVALPDLDGRRQDLAGAVASARIVEDAANDHQE